MNRRDLLKTGMLGLFSGFVGFDQPIQATNLKYVPDVADKVGCPRMCLGSMSGCIGKSTNPPLSEKILGNLTNIGSNYSLATYTRYVDSVEAVVVIASPNLNLSFQGIIPEYNALKDEYDAKNEGDLLMKMFEKKIDINELDEDWQKKIAKYPSYNLSGFHEIFSRINFGKYTAAIFKKNKLWLFAENHSLCVIDMRETLGQVFFCPHVDIFRKVAEKVPEINQDQVVIEFPDKQVWILCYNLVNQQVDSNMIRKFKITKKDMYIDQRRC